GETQWGEAYYCGAVRRMAAFFGTCLPRLEIEQMPHGERDALEIQRWTDHILDATETTDHADPARRVAWRLHFRARRASTPAGRLPEGRPHRLPHARHGPGEY